MEGKCFEKEKLFMWRRRRRIKIFEGGKMSPWRDKLQTRKGLDFFGDNFFVIFFCFFFG